MTKKETNFDLTKIKSIIRKTHKSFIDGTSSIGEKAEADKDLVKTRVVAKIRAIIGCFKSELIIDEFAEQNPSNAIGVDTSVVCFVLSKKEHRNHVYIMTDGKTIVVKDSSFMIDFGNMSAYYKKFYVEDVDNFDWQGFSENLLDHVHSCVYNRREVNQLKVFG